MSSVLVRRLLPVLVCALAVAAVTPAFGATPVPPPAPPSSAPLPAWEKLTPAQREQLIAPTRDRWNAAPEDRQRMLERAQRWTQMTPEQRRDARRGMKRWENLSPEQRDEIRELFRRTQGLPDAERYALKHKWLDMTPEQRRAWMQAHPAPADAPEPRAPSP